MPAKLLGKVTLVHPDDTAAPSWGGLEKVYKLVPVESRAARGGHVLQFAPSYATA
jgi:hypothetical protein